VRGGTRELAPAPSPGVDSAAFQVHAALIDLASATREHFALLSVPNAWEERALAKHVELLRNRLHERHDATHAASFAAIHHPWLKQRGSDGLVYDHPPEGALLAQYARRTRGKGSWAAPGLDPLVSTSGLSAALDPDLLESAGCNAIEVRPRGVSATRAATLDADDVDWSSIGVRRLFILLRKVVRREGERYAFEPNDGVLRRSLERSFDEVLRGLLQRGAFRGSRASEAYELRIARAAELRREIERGECSLEIRVAPAFPLRFLTLYAVRNGDQWQVQEGS
jgi:phage tail sheath protein FI